MYKSIYGNSNYDLSKSHQILNLYNSTTDTPISQELFDELQIYINSFVKIADEIDQIPTISNLNNKLYPDPTFALGGVEFRESTNHFKTIGSNGKVGERADRVNNNLIELNVNPINTKAITRGIPLANLYRYANYGKFFVSEPVNLDDILKTIVDKIKESLKENDGDFGLRKGINAIVFHDD